MIKKLFMSAAMALASLGVWSATPSQMEFTWQMNPFANTIAAPGGGAYDGVAYLLYVGSGYTGKQAELENAFKSGSGLDLNNLPTGMALLDQCDIINGTMSERKVKTHTEVASLDNYWVMAVMFYGDKMLSANIQQPTPAGGTAYKMGNSYTKDGQHWVGPGSVTLPGPSLRVSMTSVNVPYDGQVHGLDFGNPTISGYDDGTPTVLYSLDGTTYNLTWLEVKDQLPKDVTETPFRVYVKATLDGYHDGKASATVTITKKPVTLTAKDAEKPYDGTALTQAGFDAEGFVGTEGVMLSMTSASTVTKVGKADNVIDQASVAAKANTKLSNYSFTYVKGLLEVKVNETALAAEAVSYEGVYDGQPHNITVNVTEKPAGSTPVVTYSRSETGSFVTLDKFTQQKNATTAPVTIYARVSLEGYKTVELSRTVSIAKRAVTVTADSAERAYNGSALTCKTYKVTPESPTTTEGFVAGEGIASVSIGSSITNPGSTANVISGISFKSGTDKNNYEVTKVNGTLKVTENPTGLKVSATAYAGVYDGKGHLPTVTFDEKPASSTPTVKYSRSKTGPFVPAAEFELPKNAGEAVTVWVEASLTGYKSSVASATVKIDKRPVILVAGSASREYDGKPLTSAAFSVKANPDTSLYPVYGFTGSDGVKSVKMTAASTVTDVGTKDNEIDPDEIVAKDGANLSNYDIILEKGLLEVKPNTTGLRAQVTAVSANYSGQPTNVAVNVYQKPSGSTPTVTYAYAKEGPYLPAGEFVAPKDATGGNVKVWVKVSLANYADVVLQSTVSIAKRTVILVADSQTFDYDHLPHACETWHVKDDPGTYAAYGFLPGEGVESLAMTAASTVTRPPCDEAGCSPVANVIDETSLVAKEGTDLANYNILFEKGTLRVAVPADTFLWLRYHDTLITDNWGNPFTGKAYLIDYGVIPSPSNVGVSPDEQALEKAFTSDDGIDLDDLPCRPAPSGEKLKVIKVVNIENGEFADTPDHTIDIHASTTNWYKMVFFMESRTPSGDKKLDMYRGYAGAQIPRDTGYLKFPYELNYRTTEQIQAGSGYPKIGDYNHWAYVGPGKLREDDPEPEDAMLTAKLAWAQNFGGDYTGTGTFFARLEIACTNGSASTLSSVRFAFQDRVVELSSSTLLAAQLYDSTAPAGPISATETFGGETFRSLALDLALSKLKAAAKDEFVRVGPASVEGYVVSMEDRKGTPEMNSVSRGNPSTLETLPVYADLPDYKKYCWLVWTSNGHTYALPISPVTGAGETSVGGIPVPAPKLLLKAAPKLLTVAQNPVEVPSKNFYDSISIGLPINEGEVPSCRFTEFAVTEETISGRIETAVGETKSIPPTASGFATVTLLGTDSLGKDFVSISTVDTDGDGRFTLTKPKDYAFFRIVISIGPMFIEK